MQQFTPDQNRVVPGNFGEGPRPSWEDKLRTVGVAIGAIVAAVLAWFLASNYF
jgi:hypothetical protein